MHYRKLLSGVWRKFGVRCLTFFGTSQSRSVYQRYPNSFHSQYEHLCENGLAKLLQSIDIEFDKIKYEILKAEEHKQIPEKMRAKDWLTVRNSDQSQLLASYLNIKTEQETLNNLRTYRSKLKQEIENTLDGLDQAGCNLNSFMCVDRNAWTKCIQERNAWKDIHSLKFGKPVIIFNKGVCNEQFQSLTCFHPYVFINMNRAHLSPLCIYYFHFSASVNESYPFIMWQKGNLTESTIIEKDRLVYISNVSENFYNPKNDDIPVLFNQSFAIGQHSILTAAEKFGIRHASFPIEKYIHIGKVPRHPALDLTVPQQLEILRDLELGLYWETAITRNIFFPPSSITKASEIYKHIRQKRDEFNYKLISDLTMAMTENCYSDESDSS
ncbi:uncharacterized protein LOC127846746 [Dreissena polymorpha]|uniref:Uncharacterized protein n=1 Tax=Dreissena polymorpha TaxID=45954 RepID=A0A9D4IKK2_DREPO|nr:uncharacterized protein LOC127846746 [Dreissena polymorpha]XP_052234210.1 uncharacterized protein LOC127846746 [Dreissena polymorpha]XP_052234211.1 uncharacterized protein LOC127846746 [Dreissena polymorpha]XP_052234212.1 uncharacterized protein LOC127846746 [Dreissena polymorpha]XP_052234213.1 uncharacterized protein LOC127846746 [Dreissena polymorpha]XP_052234214.1 uncharacterized protein LOC127846746 [Dreissena polymorpha]XP_052234215.1 uncharacterized protein LOC127846746 [Dreissena po